MDPLAPLKTLKILIPSLKLPKYFKSYINEFMQSQLNPLKVQEKILLQILRENEKTVYGLRYDFSSIKTVSDFQKKVPIITYVDIKDDVDMIKKGALNVLTKKKVVFLATTSGTTSEPKLIPVTKDRIKFFKKEFFLWALYVLSKRRKILSGKTLYFAGPYNEGTTEGGLMIGSISGYLAWKTPLFAKRKLVLPPAIYNEFNFNKKTKKIALLALQANITQLAFAAPVEALLFFDYLKKNRKKLINELKQMGKNRRARNLAKLDSFKPIAIWPNLFMISCIKSDAQVAYLNILKEAIGVNDIEIRDPGIYASEGRISLGITGHDAAGILMANEIFYEFCPKLSVDKYGKPVTIEKLKLNKSYKVLITTPEGLYRYDMGDVIQVIDFKKKLPIIKFVNRNNFLNIVGELAPESQLIKAMQITCKQFSISPKLFTYIPYHKTLAKRPRYEVLFEAKDSFPKTIAKEFILFLDKTLQEQIQDYRQMRNEFGRLDSPVLTILKKGSSAEYDKKRSTASGQAKPIHVAKDSSFRNNFTILETFGEK